MKKQTKKVSGVAIVRNATGLSQQKFGSALGVTKATIENIELFRSPINAELKEAIGMFAGAVPWTLDSNDGPKDCHGEPYSASSWQGWQAYTFDEPEINKLTELAQAYIRTLLEAAVIDSAGRNHSHVFRAILMAFNRFIFTEIQNHRLESRINNLMQERFSVVDDGTCTVKKARSVFRHSPGWDDNEKSNWRADTKVRYRRQSILQLVPFVGFSKLRDGTPVFAAIREATKRIYDLDIEGHKFRVVTDGGKMEAVVSVKSKIGKEPPGKRRKQLIDALDALL